MELTFDQVNQLKTKGLSDSDISTMAQSKGYTLPQPKPLSDYQVADMKSKGLSDTEISTLANDNGYSLPKPIGGFQGFVQAVAKPFLKVASSANALLNVGNSSDFNQIQNVGTDFGYLGVAKPVGAGFDVTQGLTPQNIGAVKDSVGTGAEIASYLVGGEGGVGAVKTGLKGAVLQGAKQGAITGAAGGGIGSFGSALQEADSQPSDIAYKTLFGTVAGGALGLGLGAIAPIAVKVGNTIKKFTDITQINGELNKLNQEVFKPTKTQLKNFGTHDTIQTYTDIFGTKLPQVDKNNRFLKESVDEFAGQVNDVYKPASEAFSTILKNSPETISLSQAKADAIAGLEKFSSLTPEARTKALDKIDSEFNALKAEASSKGWLQGEDSLPVFYADHFKDRFWGATKNFGSEESSISNAVNRNSGFAFKNGIENAVQDLGVKNFNNKLGDLITLRDFMYDIAGKQAGTGGKMTRLVAGRLAGTVAGSAGGLPGAIAGNITGDILARVMIDPTMQPYRWLINKKLSQLPQAEIMKLESEANAVLQSMYKKRMETLTLPAPRTPQGMIKDGGTNVLPRGAESIIPPAPTTFEAPAKQIRNESQNIKAPNVKTSSKNANPTVGKTVDPLIQEAKKYKSAEEFVKAQRQLLHGTNAKFDKFDVAKSGDIQPSDWGQGAYFTDNIKNAKDFAKVAGGDIVMERYAPSVKFADGSKLLKDSDFMLALDDGMGFTSPAEYLAQKGYGGVVFKNPRGFKEFVVFDPEKLLTKSQLTDIWNKANSTGSINKGLMMGVAGTTGLGALGAANKGKIDNAMSSNFTVTNPKGKEINVNAVEGVNIKDYATDPTHEQKVATIVRQLPELVTTDDITKYINKRAPNSPITGEMVNRLADKYDISPKLLLGIFQQDSMFGTKGLGAKTKNVGNYGNTDSGKRTYFKTWEAGAEFVAKWLSEHKDK